MDVASPEGLLPVTFLLFHLPKSISTPFAEHVLRGKITFADDGIK
jgi:hypothetical protein